ncbi:MAG: ribonuclease HII [Bacteroidales bacterium]|nr:ribonuclease HII [Bacteroidales bacterium]
MSLKSRYNRDKKILEAGLDESGRGCLAGPVVAAAVVLPENFSNQLVNDSKKLNHKKRMNTREVILDEAVTYGIGIVWNEKIDEINILNATYLAMHMALDELKPVPEMLLIDGNRFKAYKKIEYQCIIKGDGLYFSIAAASILAKTERDLIMMKLHEEFPEFRWNKNKGYPTKDHQKSIAEYGVTKYHRKSFNLNPQLTLDF